MNAPTERDIKRLFALSLNQCAFPGCFNGIFTLSDEMIGEICHIKASKPGGPRYDPHQTDQERHGFGNLILLCRNHHKIVDDNQNKYSADVLVRMKQEHERNGSIELSPAEARQALRLLDSYKVAQALTQIAVGDKNVQVAGDYYAKPPLTKVTVAPRPGAISPEQRKQVQDWIMSLAENTTGRSRDAAFKMWWSRFKNRFNLDKYEELLAADFPLAQDWYRQQMAMQVRGLKTKDADAWRKARYGAIHAVMGRMGVEKLVYYADISTRLKLKRPFTSLIKLTNRDLERVYSMVLRDAREGGL